MTSRDQKLDYESATAFLLGRINYERTRSVPYQTRHFKLGRMQALLDRLGNPERRLKVVHIAGTKGKGSTAAMIASILHAAGHRVGLYTSPHLQGVEERMAIDGTACSRERLADLVESVRAAVEAMDRQAAGTGAEHDAPTYFEVLTAMAFLHFDREGVDLAVMEVGLGGRLDSTSVCRPIVSVITSISLDHTKQLGNTLSAIAKEKAGIIKPEVPVVSGVRSGQARQVIEQTARRHVAPLTAIDDDFEFQYQPPPYGTMSYRDPSGETPLELRNVELGLLGEHQAANAALALATVGRLQRQGWDIPEKAIRRGLADVRCPARIELVAGRPPVIVDVAHNTAAVAALMRVLEESFANRRRVLVFAATHEKDHRGMLAELLPGFTHVILTRYQSNPRSVPPEQLAALADELRSGGKGVGGKGVGNLLCEAPSGPFRQKVPDPFSPAPSGPFRQKVPDPLSPPPDPFFPPEIVPMPEDAWNRARRLAGREDLICITGSFFIAAELRPLVIKHAATSADLNWNSA